MKELVINQNEKVLIIAPHPDDESIGCGGLLLKYGSQCDVICLTDGRQGQGDITPIELAKIRAREFESAMRFVRVSSYKMLGIEDGTLCGATNVLERIDLSIYSKIFVTGISDNHPDHTAALIALKNAFLLQQIEDIEVYIYEVHRKNRKADTSLLITDLINNKKKLICIYDSQIRNIPFDSKIEKLNLENGNGEEYIEAYEKIDISNLDIDLGIEIELQKSREFYWIYTRWMKLKNKGYFVSNYLINNGFTSVIIYGYKEIGMLLEEDLAQNHFKVEYILDSNNVLKEKYPEKILCPADVVLQEHIDTPVIVTATYYYSLIKQNLLKSGYTNIYSFKRILEEMEYNVESERGTV